ncbi:phage tail family protein [Paenibacillus larvae]|nr:phage tail domain-containing protein [Paenibacillus larvae]MDT2277403.1 phage tail family protein [Paenibacillus larvae]
MGCIPKSCRSPYQDGVTYVDGQIQERGMQLEFLIVAENKNHMAQLRRKISSIFNPKLGMGELECHVSDGIKRKVDCVIEIAPSFPKEKETRTTHVYSRALFLFFARPLLGRYVYDKPPNELCHGRL